MERHSVHSVARLHFLFIFSTFVLQAVLRFFNTLFCPILSRPTRNPSPTLKLLKEFLKKMESRACLVVVCLLRWVQMARLRLCVYLCDHGTLHRICSGEFSTWGSIDTQALFPSKQNPRLMGWECYHPVNECLDWCLWNQWFVCLIITPSLHGALWRCLINSAIYVIYVWD